MSKQISAAHLHPGDKRPRHKPSDALTVVIELENDEPENLAAADSRRNNLHLPHERDETTSSSNHKDSASSPPRQVIEQAASDISRGLRDAERRGAPSDVPAPGPAPENSPGGEVPATGIDRHSRSSRDEQLRKKPTKKPLAK